MGRRKGRTRKPNVPRTKSGRISKSTAENPMQVAIDARQRLHGLPEALAVDQKAGSVLGRLRLAGDITEPQYEAGEKFRKAHADMMRAIQGPKGFEVVDAASSGDTASPDYIVWAVAAVGNYRVAKDRLNLLEWFAVQRVVLEDQPPMAFMPLNSGLTVLALGYGMIRALTGEAKV